MQIIEDIEIPLEATSNPRVRGKYPFKQLVVNAGFKVAAHDAMSARSTLSRYRASEVGQTTTIEVHVMPDGSLIMKRTA